MKNLRKVYLISLLSFSSILMSYSQKYSIDSICVQIDDKIKLGMAIYDYKDLSENVEKDMKTLQAILKNKNDIPEKVSYSITYEPNKLLTIKSHEISERIILEDGKQTYYQFNNQCNVNSDQYYLQIQFNELKKLISDSLITKLKGVIDSTNIIQGRFASTYHYTFQGEELLPNKQIDKIKGQMDVLSIQGSIGVNFMKNQPVIDISAETGLTFSKKGILKNHYYLSCNLLYYFEDNSKVNINSFVNIGYQHNSSKTVRDVNWLGVELGYLVVRNGDLFGKNTLKLGFNWEIGKYISVTPQIYISESKDLSFPAVRIGFGF